MLHLDLYRLDAGELLAAGVDEMLEADAVVVVEWAERLPLAWRAGARVFRLERLDSGDHRIVETAC